MSEQELTERLAEAGKKYDGHVTNGSLAAQVRVVLEVIGEIGLEFQDENLISAAHLAYVQKIGREARNDS